MILGSGPYSITLRFYEELNDFLPLKEQKIDHTYLFTGKQLVRDMIEAFNVPHPEIELIIVNGKSVSFDYIPKHQDRIAVYPVFESFDVTPAIKLRESPLRHTQFICDVHLGKLARYLRMAGFDVLYRNDYDDPEIAEISEKQLRIVLTHDIKLLCRKQITHGYWIRSMNSREQFVEVIKRFQLENQLYPFTRCPTCNGLLKKVPKKEVINQLEPLTKKYYDEFAQCTSCEKIYWEGSHTDKILEILKLVSI